MMILPEAETTGDRFAKAFANLGRVGSQLIPQHFMQKQKAAQQGEFLKKLGLEGLEDPELQKVALAQKLKTAGQKEVLQDQMSLISGLKGPARESGQQTQAPNIPDDQFAPEDFSDEQIAMLSLVNPQAARIVQSQKEHQEKKGLEERKYHSEYAKKEEEEANKLRESLPKKQNALGYARRALETGELGFFSKDKLADATGIDLFRTASGAQLKAAGKENLLANLSRVSAKGQNVWFEKRLDSIFAQIGQSKEANLSLQEMLESEMIADEAYLKEFDRLSAQDEAKYGYTKKDIKKRALDAVKPLQKEVFDRSVYRMKELEEQEKGLTKLKNEVGKNVPPGTPMTLAMVKLYRDKFGDKAREVAKKNGYKIPSFEEFKIYQMTPEEYRAIHE